MGKINWRNIKKKYGVDVVRYMENNSIIPELVDRSVYKMPNVAILDHCSKLAKQLGRRDRLRCRRKRKRPRSFKKPETSQNCYNVPDHVRCIINVKRRKSETMSCPVRKIRQAPAIPSNLQISFDHLFKERNQSTHIDFSRRRRPLVDDSWKKMFEHMMNTNIGGKKMVEYQDCLEDVKCTIETFQGQHEKFKYFSHLENVMEDKGSTDDTKPRISYKQFAKFFHTVFTRVIPHSLFGSNYNVKIIKRCLQEYFLASWEETINLKNHIFSLNISCITWLSSIKDDLTKWSIILRVVKWLFEVYIFGILKSVFHVRKDLYTEEKVVLSSLRWRKQKRHHVKLQKGVKNIEEKKCVSDIGERSSHLSGLVDLFPKKNGVRLIYYPQLNESTRDELKMLKTLLQQLYSHNYENTTVNDINKWWLNYARKTQLKPGRKTYLVSSDVQDAYGSVVQTKLFSILNSMINEIPDEKLTLKWFATLEPNSLWKKNKIEYNYWFNFCTEVPRIKPHTMIAPVTNPINRKTFISKHDILMLLQKYIIRPTLNETPYVLSRGLLQGSSISAILSEIYYAHMTRENFEIFQKSGTLIRFVDDFLYITNNEESAIQFIHKIKRGVTKYYRFNLSKTKTNVKSKFLLSSRSITFLGNHIDSQTLNVTPRYGRSSFRHLKSLHKISYKNEIPTFTFRLMNFSSLKLSPMILDTRINRPKAIVSTAGLVGKTMASRCAVLISKIFNRLGLQAHAIWDQIVKAVKKLFKIFFRNIHLRRFEGRTSLKRNIEITIWRSFYKVFVREANLHLHFCPPIKRMIINRKIVKSFQVSYDKLQFYSKNHFPIV